MFFGAILTFVITACAFGQRVRKGAVGAMNHGDIVADALISADKSMSLQQFYEIRSHLYTVQDIDIVAARYG